MKLHEKVKFYREYKRLSQESVAYELGLNQSQYSRRESGNILFNADEIAKLSALFEISANELFGEETIIFNNTNQSGGNFAQYINLPQELIDQYEKRIREKDELIQVLKEQIQLLESLKK